MNTFDTAVLQFFNQFAERSWTFDSLMVLIGDTDWLKGYLILPLLWWAWFRGAKSEEDRRRVLLTLCAALSAVAIARLLQLMLPYRARPVHSAELHFTIPYSFPTDLLAGWSSFPSDHAALFFALAAGLLVISPVIGGLALLHATLIVSLPRIYLGLHYPTDLLAGAILGVTTMVLVWKFRSAFRPVVDPALTWSRASPQFFYPAFFLLTSELAHLFKDTRWVAESLWHIAKLLMAR